MCSEDDIRAAVADAGIPERINIVPPRACAYVTMPDRRSAFKIMDRLAKDMQIGKKSVKVQFFAFPKSILAELGHRTRLKE